MDLHIANTNHIVKLLTDGKMYEGKKAITIIISLKICTLEK